MDPKTAVSYVGSVSPGSTGKTRRTFERAGTVTGAVIPTYPGQELELRTRLTLESASGATTPLIDYQGEQYIAGNGELFDLSLRQKFQAGDTLVIEVTNNDDTYTYTSNAHVEVDYGGGLEEMIEKLLNTIPTSGRTGRLFS